MALARISITLARELLTAADRRAKQLQRSRSWVVAEALRRFVAGPGAVREPEAPVYAAHEVAEARRRHLRAELALPAGERLRRAEELGHLARHAQRRGQRHQVIGFDSYEDFYEWRKARIVGV